MRPMLTLPALLSISLSVGCGPLETADRPAAPGQSARTTLVGDAHGGALIRILHVDEHGELGVEAEAPLDPNGRYAVAVRAGLEGVVVQSVDDDGDVASATLLARTGANGEVVQVNPTTVESTVEAEVWLRAVAQEPINLVEVQRRIDGVLATAVQTAPNPDTALVELADVLRAGQAAQLQSLAAAGVETTVGELFAGQADASMLLTSSLAEGADARAAQAELDARVEQALAGLGADAERRSRVEATVSASMRLMAEAVVTDGNVYAELVRDAAGAEADAVVEAMASLFSGAADDLQAEVADRGAELREATRIAVDEQALADAFATYEHALLGGLADPTEAALLAEVVADGIRARHDLIVLAEARLAAEAVLDAELAAVAMHASPGDVDGMASAVVDAEARFEAAVNAAAAATSLQDVEADLVARISIEAAAHAAYAR